MRISRQMGLRIGGPGRRPGSPGFTLAEILVAVGVLLVAFLGVITVYMVGYGDISEGGRDTTAAMAAQTLAENIRHQPQANLWQLNNMDTANSGFCAGVADTRMRAVCVNWTNQISQLPEGQGVVVVIPIPNPNTAVLFQRININVAWTDSSRGRRLLTMVVGRSN